jgi:hypothetical protein
MTEDKSREFNNMPEASLTNKSVDEYTEIRRRSLSILLKTLDKKGVILKNNLQDVRDLGSFQGSSSQALRDIGASRVVSVDNNLNALRVGEESGYITEPVGSDLVDYAKNNLDTNFRGLVSAFNCILYLPEDRIRVLLDSLKLKLHAKSQFVFSFSKNRNEWEGKFDSYFRDNRKFWSIIKEKGVIRGDLDYYLYVATKR